MQKFFVEGKEAKKMRIIKGPIVQEPDEVSPRTASSGSNL